MRKLIRALSALIAVLLITGLAYSLWSANVFISGTIETGTVEGVWVSAAADDQGTDPGYDKDVGRVLIDGLGTDTLTVIIDNAYPCYSVTITAVYEYTGTVPAIVNETLISCIGWEPASGPGANDGPVWLEITHDAEVGRQLHQGDTITVTIKVHVEQCADQDESYPFTVQVVLIQWNEYVPPAQVGTSTLGPNYGNDTTNEPYELSDSDLRRLTQSDDDRYEVQQVWESIYIDTEYLDLEFEDISLPPGATIVSVVLKFEWCRSEAVNGARIVVYVGPGEIGTIDLSPLPDPGQDRTEEINLMDLGIDTVGEINGLRIRFQATGDGMTAKTHHDLAVVEVTYIT